MRSYKLVYRPLEDILPVLNEYACYLGVDPESDEIHDQLVAIRNREAGPSCLPALKALWAFIKELGRPMAHTLEEAEVKVERINQECNPTEKNYSTNRMPYHVGLVLDGKLFEYEDDNMYYQGYKDYNENYNSKIKWKDLCPSSDNLEIHGKTTTTPDMLDAFIKCHIDSSWRTEGNYKLFKHNCQHFTHFCVNLLENKQ